MGQLPLGLMFWVTVAASHHITVKERPGLAQPQGWFNLCVPRSVDPGAVVVQG